MHFPTTAGRTKIWDFFLTFLHIAEMSLTEGQKREHRKGALLSFQQIIGTNRTLDSEPNVSVEFLEWPQ